MRVELNGARGPESFLDAMADLVTCAPRRRTTARWWSSWTTRAHETPDLVNALVGAGARITGVREEAATLEEVYLELVGEAGVRDEHAWPMRRRA